MQLPTQTSFLGNLKAGLMHLHRDEQGAEGIEKILIICAIILPLLLILIFFRNAITDWVTGQYDKVTEGTDSGSGSGNSDPGFGSSGSGGSGSGGGF